MSRRDGFPGQRMRVVPAPLVRQVRRARVTAGLVVTDCGYFPRAEGHARRRAHGVPEGIVMICAEGGGYLEIEHERHPVGPGQVVVVPPGEPHEYGASEETPWTLWWLHVRGDCAEELFDRIREAAGRPVFSVRSVSRLIPLVDGALRLLEEGDSAINLRASTGMAWHLLTLLPVERQRRTVRQDPVHLARELLVGRLPQRTSVEELARLVGLSTSHLSTMFKQSFGYGILEYQTRQRMAMACALLTTTELPIAAVAREVGYEDPYYFSRQFHNVHGVSPREYRGSVGHLPRR